MTRRELHIRRQIRDRLGLSAELFAFDGQAVLADLGAARDLAHRLNQQRPQEAAIRASDLNALGLIDEILHVMLATYRREGDADVLASVLDTLERELGREATERLLVTFVDEFPPTAVWQGAVGAAEWLEGATAGELHREAAVEELLLLALTNENPASAPLRELFADDRLRSETDYERALEILEADLGERPELPATGETLLDVLRSPWRTAPDSLEAQLDFIRTRWGGFLGEAFGRLLTGLDMIAEESKPFFGFGPGPVEIPVYGAVTGPSDDPELEAYSPDTDWMPRVVMLAKNVYVWLHQLSRTHEIEITTLDAVPDTELDRLARSGFTALWLIGVWQRSRASATIKQWMGDHDAVASAYSLDDYRIADDLGGEEAFDRLKERAARRGIRLATDMVPNHVGIDSRWVVEHPDWFIQRRHPPFPGYSFSGADLCGDERVGVYLEDHYWDRTDAAVVFKRVDHWTGDVRYIYHGNDGTSMPWNDTAQLDYRRADVREAVIQTILHVARRSPVIRFDAAMTLTKKHFHRLWFPEPGTGGDIPSRAEEGMTRPEFDHVMPQEFWREVVDRVAAEAPDTLLLAEAFWLLEGYFVRTLGMHRVYNSAFMNMLRDERNADYRQLIKNTLEFDPQILKRYVNFMSNPDERTAIDQFGTEGKYFGVATLMATLPGLPMFAHGQIEGYAEKYGMEFQRPRWDERPKQWLLERHERQVFPLLHRRRLFAEVDEFLLYDFEHAHGGVDENVFAYSNSAGGERSLVVYHNRFGDTRGWLRTSAAKAVREGEGTRLERWSLAAGLGITPGKDRFVRMRDAATGLEYLRAATDLVEDGLWVELGAYELHVLVDFEEIVDVDGSWTRVCDRLAGRGVGSLDEARHELELDDVLAPLRKVLEPARLEALLAGEPAARREAEETFADDAVRLLAAVGARTASPGRERASAALLVAELVRVLELGRTERVDRPLDVCRSATAAAWQVVRVIAAMHSDDDPPQPRRVVDGWRLPGVIGRCLEDLGAPAETIADAIRLLVAAGDWLDLSTAPAAASARLVERLVRDPQAASVLGVNRFDGVDWYREEAVPAAWPWLAESARLGLVGAGTASADEVEARIEAVGMRLEAAHRAAGCRVERLLGELGAPSGSRARGETTSSSVPSSVPTRRKGSGPQPAPPHARTDDDPE